MYNFYAGRSRSGLPNYRKTVYFKKSLVIETYIIGYKIEGESILFFIRADEGIYFSGLVDCYRTKDVDKVKDILQENAISRLNFICWTHPDTDHSEGLNEIIDIYASEDTYIWIPEGVDEKELKFSKKVQNLYYYLKTCTMNVDSNLNVYSVSDRKDLMSYSSLCFQKGLDFFPLEITSYAPNSKVIRKQNYLNQFIKNDRSIFCVIALGQIRIWLTGDIEDGTIERIPRDFLEEHIHILKIPHHGSESSGKIMQFGQGGCEIACSTVYRRGKNSLPVRQIMEQYEQFAETLFCTGNINPKSEHNKYGIVKVITDVLDNSYKTVLEGNAAIWGTEHNSAVKLADRRKL